jgi:hypothetical protein
VAHKTNNPIQSLGEQPFERMLRRHLQRNGATVQPCDGFDAETANAYLERALLASAQQAYETHLADCGACRQHVTTLARLNTGLRPAPLVAPQPQPIAEPFWTRWMAQAAAWWNEISFGWGLAGAGATACVLIAAFAFYGSQQAKNAQPVLTAASTAPAEYSTAEQVNPALVAGNDTRQMTLDAATPVPTNAPLLARESVLAKSEVAAANSAPVGQPAAAPSLPPLPPSALTAGMAPPPSPVRVINLPAEELAFVAERPSAPVIELPRNNDFFPGNARQGGVLIVGLSPGGGMRTTPWDVAEPVAPGSSLNHVKDQLARQSSLAKVTADERALRLEDERKETKSDKSEPGRMRAIIETLKPQGSFSLVPKKKADAPTKEADKTTDSPLSKPMTKQVNGHTLYFERSMWIDGDYKANTTLPLIKLTRGSQRYQQVLIDNPMLEEFFQLAPVIVVWKGKIYEVRKGQ